VKVVISQGQIRSNLHKIGKYGKEIEDNRRNSEPSVSIHTKSAPAVRYVVMSMRMFVWGIPCMSLYTENSAAGKSKYRVVSKEKSL